MGSLLQCTIRVLNEQGLIYIASAWGRILYAHVLMEKYQTWSHAKIFAEVEVDSIFHDSVEVVSANGNRAVLVKYPWKPSRCFVCECFCHTDVRFRGPSLTAGAT